MVQMNLPYFLRQVVMFGIMILWSLAFSHQNASAMTASHRPAISSIPSFGFSSQRVILSLRAEPNDFSEERLVSEENYKINQAKQALFQSFHEGDVDDDTTLFRLHKPTKERTALVTDMTRTNPTPSPGSAKSFAGVAPGIWRVVYAPHIATFGIVATKVLSAFFSLSPLFNRGDVDGSEKESIDRTFSVGFDPVYYLLRPDGSMTSHARLVVQYPSRKETSVTWFSVAGTYSSQDEDRVCRVDFDQAWVQTSENSADPLTLPPFASLDQVPDGFAKNVINALGRFFFIDAVSVFPVSFLDDDCIVFDFELLGTRILAKKVHTLKDSKDESGDAVLQFLAEKER